MCDEANEIVYSWQSHFHHQNSSSPLKTPKKIYQEAGSDKKKKKKVSYLKSVEALVLHVLLAL